MTIDSIRQGIVHTLQQHFPDIPVLAGSPGEDFVPPGFELEMFPVEQSKEMGRRYRRSQAFVIRYYPAAETTQAETLAVAESLLSALEYIEDEGSLIRGNQFREEIVDGVFHFYGTYAFHLMKQKPASVRMRTMNQEGIIR
ncbi:phage tail terminator family protein [Paenibacillus senegalensis]|uniref:phage tail terminator family protein n=1 Tax=Paenibacillus senegalensis TaxID=1465766 RepID=UPI000288BD85|nr:hypothetical protein [Paenibacillus senegalensis]